MKNDNYGETKIYIITSYIMWFGLSSILFILLNMPALLLLISVKSIEDLKNFGLLAPVMLLTLGPSYTALLYTMGKLYREKELSTIKTFFKGYRESFFQSLTFWTIQVFTLYFLIFDIRFLSSIGTSSYVISLWYGFIFLVFFITVHIYPIIARFKMKNIDILKLSFIYSVRKLYITTANMLLTAAMILLSLKYPNIVIFFGPAILSYLIMVNERNIIKEIEENLKIKM